MTKKLLLTIIVVSLIGCASKNDDVTRVCNFGNEPDVRDVAPPDKPRVLMRYVSKIRSSEVSAVFELPPDESVEALEKLVGEAGIKSCPTLDLLKELNKFDREPAN